MELLGSVDGRDGRRSHLSGEEQRRVVVLRVPLAGRVEPLLPGAEVEQSEASIAGDSGAHLFVLYHQHLHHHHVH